MIIVIIIIVVVVVVVVVAVAVVLIMIITYITFLLGHWFCQSSAKVICDELPRKLKYNVLFAVKKNRVLYLYNVRQKFLAKK